MPKPLTNRFNLPEPFVRAVSYDDYDAGDVQMSVTGLLRPPQLAQLEHEHADEIEEDVIDRHFLLEGKALHHWLWYSAEQRGDDYIPERRLFTEILGWRISGQSDLYFYKGELLDYKRTHSYSLQFDKPEWVQQLNGYAMLWREHGYEVNEVYVIASLRDWSKSRARKYSDYPQAPLVKVDLPLWTEGETRAFFEERVRLHQQAREQGVFEECTEEERWFNAREGAYLRCRDYCRVSHVCPTNLRGKT